MLFSPLGARKEKQANPSHSCLQTLAFPFFFFSPFSFKNGICSSKCHKTTFLVFINQLKCKAMFSLHPFSHFPFFFVLSHLILIRPRLAQNPLFHLSLLLFHFDHSFIINSPRHLFFIIIDPYRSLFYKFSHFPFFTWVISVFNQFSHFSI